MNISTPIRPPLIVDPNQEYLLSLRNDPRAERIPPLLATEGKTAQRMLADLKQEICAVFVNLDTGKGYSGPGGLSVIRSAHSHRVGVPIFVIYDDRLLISDQDLRRLAVQRAIPKPLSYGKILELANPVVLFDPSAAMSTAKRNQDSVDAEISEDDSSFVPVRATDFLSGTTAYFDVYVRLSSGRFVKLLQAGDSFTTTRLAQYIAKGVTHFHIRREAQVHYLNYCDRLASTLLESPKIAAEIKTTQTLNHGEETISFLKRNGLSDTSIGYATDFVGNVGKLAKQLKTERHDVIRQYLSNIVTYDHAVSTSMVAALIAREMQIEAESSVQIVGMAALLHDIGLQRLPAALQNEDESTMSEGERGLYHTHPMTGALILKSVRGIHPSTIQAVAQHHERRDQSGFPGRVSPGKVNRVAEIIGMADEFVRIGSLLKANPKFDFKGELEKRIFSGGFSHNVTESFRNAFFMRADDEEEAKKAKFRGSAPRRRPAA